MKTYIQIGAGVGDQDYSAGFRDGFSAHVKKVARKENPRIIVMEANKLNIDLLLRSWNTIPGVIVLNVAIASNDMPEGSQVKFYFAPEDAPFYQISSTKESHVRKFFPDSKLEIFSVDSWGINQFLEKYVANQEVELLALDIEGLDSEVILALDLSKFKVHKLSFERTHDAGLTGKVNKKLTELGYIRGGMGMDPHNSDVLWVKPENLFETLRFRIRDVKHRLWEIQIPARHFIKLKLHSFLG